MAKSLHTRPNTRAIAGQLRQAEHDHAVLLERVTELRDRLSQIERLADRYSPSGAVPVDLLRATVEEVHA